MEKEKKRRFKKRYIAYGLLFSYIIMCQACMTMRTSSKATKVYFEKEKTVYIDKTADFGDYKIHYIATGNAENPTLFFIHGSPGSWDAYKTYLSDTLLLKKYRMIAIDRPGFGYSNFGDAQDLGTQSSRIYSFIKTIDNHKPIVLIGHSLGGPVVVKLATENPDKYKHIFILAGAVDPKAETPESWRPILMTIPFRYLIPGALRPSNDELWWLKSDLIAMQPNLKKITSDVTIIHGTKDPLVPYSNVFFMQKEFVNAKSIQVIAIENANHFIPWEHFDEIRDALLDIKLE
ncbi:MAG: alpha/beta hydrolase [Flavobacterium sp.]|nr:alpha/beta hydrolase [Flavobacterium sp.]